MSIKFDNLNDREVLMDKIRKEGIFNARIIDYLESEERVIKETRDTNNIGN